MKYEFVMCFSLTFMSLNLFSLEFPGDMPLTLAPAEGSTLEQMAPTSQWDPPANLGAIYCKNNITNKNKRFISTEVINNKVYGYTHS